MFALDAAWRLHPQVAVRPEPFGALLYHFGTRRLSFLKDRALTDAVRALGTSPDARTACAATGLDPVPAEVVAALTTLADTGMIVPRDHDPQADARPHGEQPAANGVRR